MLRRLALLGRAALPAAGILLVGRADGAAQCMPVHTIQRTDAPIFLVHRDPHGGESGVQTVSSPARKRAQTECENYARRLLELVRVPASWSSILEKSHVLSPSDFFSFFHKVHPRIKAFSDRDIDDIFNDLQDDMVHRDGRKIGTAAGELPIESLRSQNGLPRSYDQCCQQTQAIVEKYRDHADTVEKLHMKTLDLACKEDRQNDGKEDSDLDDEFNPSARQGKRKEARSERLRRNSERCQSNACVLMRQPLLFGGTVASDETLQAITRSQCSTEPEFPGREFKWALRGDIPLDLHPSSGSEAIHVVGLIIQALMVGSCVKVNDGEYLKASIQSLQVSQHFKVPEFGVPAADLAYIPVWVDAFRNWQTLHTMVTAQKKLSGAESMAFFWHMLDDLREWQRVEKQPASVYLAKQTISSDWRRIDHILSAVSVRGGAGSSALYTPRTGGVDAAVCQHFLKGRCNKGDKCSFVHDARQLPNHLRERPSSFARKPRFESERSQSRGRGEQGSSRGEGRERSRGRSNSRGRDDGRGERSRGTPYPKRPPSRDRSGSRSRAGTDTDSRKGE